jgi:hypothetical protein
MLAWIFLEVATMTRFALVFLTLLTFNASAATLPGFAIETLTTTNGFVTSVVTDSHGTIYFTTAEGWIHRVDGTQATPVASLPTRFVGNGGLLGMALLDDATAVVHYTTAKPENAADPNPILDDVISKVDLATGAETVIQTFVCNIEFRMNGVSSEHHGGNPTIAPDGTIYVGIGEYGARAIAQKPEWNAGKIWRIDTAGNASQWATGMRNPYDLAWDPMLGKVVVGDTGQTGGDEIHVLARGANGGWPPESHVEQASEPVYVFRMTTAPTGLARLSGANPMLPYGYLMGAFVTKAIYYFPSVVGEVGHPIPLVDQYDRYVIDVTESPNGDIVFATAMYPTTSIHRLHMPKRGDCNGDGLADWRDVYATFLEIRDGDGHPTIRAQEGEHAGSWGCDANGDSIINGDDLRVLSGLIGGRRRAAGR